MGLRCLLSHDFGEPELEREREEKGNEVIITVNEVKTCTRCGERRIVSENTEVTSMEQLTATATDEATAPDAETVAQEPVGGSPQAESAAAAEPTDSEDIGITIDDSVTDDAEVLTDDSDDGGPEDLGTATTANMTVDDVESAAAEQANIVEQSDELESADDVTSAEDDGVILDADEEDDAEDEPADREPGEWPEYEDRDEGDGEAPWPDVEGDDEGFSAEEPDGEPEDMTFGGGFTPEITKDETGSVGEAADGESSELSFTRAEEASVEFEPTVDDIETEFYCPECGLARRSGNSSMRAGDICPDCKRGYISERQT
jgi:predicted RNA-binding Zn-ribbon protein involved in translation (DUF1610 family)